MAEVTSLAPGAFRWIELGTTDKNAAKEFYGRLFGWTSVDKWVLGGKPIGGMRR